MERAKRAIGARTARATVQEALLRMAAGAEAEWDDRSAKQRDYLKRLKTRVDLEVLGSEGMWR